MAKRSLRLSITTPNDTETAVRCDSLRFSVPDGENGKNGGSIGIRCGHADALMAVAPGRIVARVGERIVLDCETTAGFAVVQNDQVTVLTDSLQITAIADEYRSAQA